jgi:hypothetical protein
VGYNWTWQRFDPNRLDQIRTRFDRFFSALRTRVRLDTEPLAEYDFFD